MRKKTLWLLGISLLSCPVFYANGNHEQRMQRDRGVYGAMYDEFRELLADYQVEYLQNKTVSWRDDIAVSGVDIAWKYYQDFHPDSMTRLILPGDWEMQILINFRFCWLIPPVFDAYADWGADLSWQVIFTEEPSVSPDWGSDDTPVSVFHPYCGGVFEQNADGCLSAAGLEPIPSISA